MAMDPIIAQMLDTRRRYAELVRDGLPIVDAVYWDWPSAMIGGYFLLQLQKARDSTGASRLDLRTPARAVRPLDAVISELKREHRPGFWYRGQRMRRDCVYRGRIPRMENTAPGINPIELTLEAIVPSAYRAYTSPRPATWSQFRLAPLLDYFAGPARAIFASRDQELGERLVSALDFMLIDAMRVSQAGEVRLGYAEHLLAPGSTVTPELLDLISIAQHYEYGSIMVDVSSSIDASTWFATRDWASGEVAGSRGGEPGVIYRIDALAVARALQNHITGPGATPPPAMQALGVFGLADIGERFSFLDRPRAQQGGSLLGMENVVTHFLMQTHRAIEAFPFDHSTVTGRETPLSRNDICPPGDRGVEIFRPCDKFASEPITVAELDQFLTRMNMEPARIRHFREMRDLGVI